MDQAAGEGLLKEWVILVPRLKGPTVASRRVGVWPNDLTILERKRRTERDDVFSGSSPRQRRAMEIISGGVDPLQDKAGQQLRNAALQYPDAARLHARTRGAFLLTFAADSASPTKPPALPDPVDPGDIATLFSLAFPKASAAVGRIGFTVKVKNAGAIIDRA